MYAGIYIRKDNEAAWLALDNKSDWVNDRLTPGAAVAIINQSARPRASAATLHPDDVLLRGEPIITDRNKDMVFCKHNAVKGLCKKGCK